MKNFVFLTILGVILVSCAGSDKLNNYGFTGDVISKTDTVYNVVYKFGKPEKGDIKAVIETFFDANNNDTLICSYSKDGELTSKVVSKRNTEGDIETWVEYVMQDFPGMDHSKYKSITTETYSYVKKEGKIQTISIKSKYEEEVADSVRLSDDEPTTYVSETNTKTEYRYDSVPSDFKVTTDSLTVSYMNNENLPEASFFNYGLITYEYNDKGLVTKSTYSSYDKTDKSENFFEYEYDDNGNVSKQTLFLIENGEKKASEMKFTHYNCKQ